MDKKAIGIEIGTMTTVILTYIGIVNYGLLIGLDHIKILTYTIPQFIFLVLLAVAVGLIASNLLLGSSKDQAIRDLKDLTGKTLGMSDKELERLKTDLTTHYKQKAMNAVGGKVNAIRLPNAGEGYPSPQELRNSIIEKINEITGIKRIYAIPSDLRNDKAVISIVPATPASSKHLIDQATHTRRNLIIIGGFAAVAIVVFFITKFLPTGVIA